LKGYGVAIKFILLLIVAGVLYFIISTYMVPLWKGGLNLVGLADTVQDDLSGPCLPKNVCLLHREPSELPVRDCTVKDFAYQPTKDKISEDTILLSFSEDLNDPLDGKIPWMHIKVSYRNPLFLVKESDWSTPQEVFGDKMEEDPALFRPMFADPDDHSKISLKIYQPGWGFLKHNYHLLIKMDSSKRIAGDHTLRPSDTCIITGVS